MPTALKEAIDLFAKAAQAKEETKQRVDQLEEQRLELFAKSPNTPTTALDRELEIAEKNKRVAEREERQAAIALRNAAANAPETELKEELEIAKQVLDLSDDEELEALTTEVELTAKQQAHAAKANAVHNILQSAYSQRAQNTQDSIAPTTTPLFERLKSALAGVCSAISNYASSWVYKQENQDNNTPKM